MLGAALWTANRNAMGAMVKQCLPTSCGDFRIAGACVTTTNFSPTGQRYAYFCDVAIVFEIIPDSRLDFRNSTTDNTTFSIYICNRNEPVRGCSYYRDG